MHIVDNIVILNDLYIYKCMQPMMVHAPQNGWLLNS